MSHIDENHYAESSKNHKQNYDDVNLRFMFFINKPFFATKWAWMSELYNRSNWFLKDLCLLKCYMYWFFKLLAHLRSKNSIQSGNIFFFEMNIPLEISPSNKKNHNE